MTSRADAHFARVYDHEALAFGSLVRIKRAGVLGEEVRAVVADSGDTVADETGVVLTRATNRSYEIAAADYTVRDEEVEPRAGDLIYETINLVDAVFEVMPPSPVEPAWQRLESDGVRWLVHAKRVR